MINSKLDYKKKGIELMNNFKMIKDYYLIKQENYSNNKLIKHFFRIQELLLLHLNKKELCNYSQKKNILISEFKNMKKINKLAYLF